VVVVIGSSTCGWSTSDDFVQLYREARDSVQAYATARDIGFATLGISQDVVLDDGIEYLQGLGRLDEVAVGRSWRNTGIRRYIYGEFSGEAATPQILVAKRSVVGGSGYWGIERERVLMRRTGLSEIRRWVQGGSQVPTEGNTQ